VCLVPLAHSAYLAKDPRTVLLVIIVLNLLNIAPNTLVLLVPI
jgi:hypothetical protein